MRSLVQDAVSQPREYFIGHAVRAGEPGDAQQQRQCDLRLGLFQQLIENRLAEFPRPVLIGIG